MTTSDGRPLRGLAGPRARRVAGLLLAGVLALVCSGPAVGSGGGGDVPPEDPDNPTFLRGFITTVGRSEALPGKQWFRVPPTAAYIRANARPDGEPGFRVEVFVASPKGAKNDWGVLPPTVVRTVAFGLAPALVTLELSQVSRGRFVEPWVLTGQDVFIPGLENHLEGRVNVRVASLEIDGHPVELGSRCVTAFPAFIEVDGGPGYTSAFGGELTGTLDVPRFTGCGQGNDRLLTSVVSAADNPLEITQSQACIDGSCPPAPEPPPEYDLPDEE